MSVMSSVSLRIEAMRQPKDEQVREASKYLHAHGYDVPSMRAQGSKFIIAWAEEHKQYRKRVGLDA